MLRDVQAVPAWNPVENSPSCSQDGEYLEDDDVLITGGSAGVWLYSFVEFDE
jgi:hypothetical protein